MPPITVKSSRAARLRRPLAISCAALLLLPGCQSLRLQPLTSEELAVRAQADAAALRAGVDPLPAQLSLAEAEARALKFNLELRQRLLEEAMAVRLYDLSKPDLLPKLIAQAGYSWRNNDRISQSRDGSSGAMVPSRFISQERDHTVSELGLSWSLLDFGVAYYRTKIEADRVLIASEKRRKAIHLLLQDVRTAYWRLASAQAMRERVQAAITLAESALGDARQAEADRVRDPAEALRYQRQILENIRLLEAIMQEWSSAEVDLATLINAPVGQPLRVAEPDYAGVKPALLGAPLAQLEERALAGNADLREQNYDARIARLEARSTFVRLFPNLSLDYSLNRDDDMFLVHQRWNSAGAQLSYSFLQLLTARRQTQLAAAGVKLADERRLAAHLAVLAQVHLARVELAVSERQLQRAREIADADRKLRGLAVSREETGTQARLERINAETAALLSELRLYQARCQAQVAEARLETVTGEDQAIPSVADMGVPELTALIAQAGGRTPIPAQTPEILRLGEGRMGPTAAPADNLGAGAATEPAVGPLLLLRPRGNIRGRLVFLPREP